MSPSSIPKSLELKDPKRELFCDEVLEELPAPKLLKKIKYGDKSFKDEERIIFINPFLLSDSLISFPQEKDYELVELFFKLNDEVKNNLDFLKKLMLFIYSNYDNNDWVCKEFSTIPLRVLSRILSDERNKFPGSIQQMSGNILDSNLLIKASHSWNIISFDSDESYFFFDIYNKSIAGLGSKNLWKDYKTVDLMFFDDEDKIWFTPKFSTDLNIYYYIEDSLQRLSNSGIYSDPEKLKLLAGKTYYSQIKYIF